MNNNIIVRQQLQAIQISDFMKLTYITLDNDRTEDIRITREGIICPAGMTTSEDTFLLKCYPNRKEEKGLQVEIDEALSFFTFLKHQKEDGKNYLFGNFRINSGRVFEVLIEIPMDYPNSSPIAKTQIDVLKDCTFYHRVQKRHMSYKFTSWAASSHIIDFIADTIAYLNKKECYMTFNIWLGSKVSSKTEEIL